MDWCPKRLKSLNRHAASGFTSVNLRMERDCSLSTFLGIIKDNVRLFI